MFAPPPGPKIFNPIDAATGSRQAKGGTRHPLQNVRNLHPHLHWDPPTTTQLRPPHPALVGFLAATLHSPLLLLHTSSPSPNSLRDLLFAANCSRSVLSGECQAFTSELWRGPFKTRLCLETAASQKPPQDDHLRAPGSFAKEQAFEQILQSILQSKSITPDGRYHIHITLTMEDRSSARGRTLDDEFDFNAGDLSKQFEQLLRTRRLNELEERARSPRSSSPASFQRRASGHSPSPYPRSPATPQSASQLSPRPSQHQPPSYQTFKSLPIVPSMPNDTASFKFRNMLVTLSHTPIKYENPGLLDEALTYVPLDRLYSEAEEEHNIMKGIAASMGDNVKPEWGYQDCVIRALLR